MFCLCWPGSETSSQSESMHVRLIGVSKLSLRVGVSANGCLSHPGKMNE